MMVIEVFLIWWLWLYAWLSVAICMVIVVISGYAWLSVVMPGFQCLVHDLVVFEVGGIKA